MPIHDLTDEFMDHVVNLIEVKGHDYIRRQMEKMGITTGSPPEVPEIKVIKGDTTVENLLPIIRISVNTPMQSEWLATRVRKDRYSFNIDTEMRLKPKDNKDQFIMGIGNAVKNWMLQWENLATTIYQTSHTYYDSFAETIQLGRGGDNSIRTARFVWWADVANTYQNVLVTT